jgi:cell wall-associated NlpC family hydrolase
MGAWWPLIFWAEWDGQLIAAPLHSHVTFLHQIALKEPRLFKNGGADCSGLVQQCLHSTSFTDMLMDADSGF